LDAQKSFKRHLRLLNYSIIEEMPKKTQENTGKFVKNFENDKKKLPLMTDVS